MAIPLSHLRSHSWSAPPRRRAHLQLACRLGLSVRDAGPRQLSPVSLSIAATRSLRLSVVCGDSQDTFIRRREGRDEIEICDRARQIAPAAARARHRHPNPYHRVGTIGASPGQAFERFAGQYVDERVDGARIELRAALFADVRQRCTRRPIRAGAAGHSQSPRTHRRTRSHDSVAGSHHHDTRRVAAAVPALMVSSHDLRGRSCN